MLAGLQVMPSRCCTCDGQKCDSGEGVRHTQQPARSDALPTEEAQRCNVRAQIRHVTGLQRKQILVLTFLLYTSRRHVRGLLPARRLPNVYPRTTRAAAHAAPWMTSPPITWQTGSDVRQRQSRMECDGVNLPCAGRRRWWPGRLCSSASQPWWWRAHQGLSAAL